MVMTSIFGARPVPSDFVCFVCVCVFFFCFFLCVFFFFFCEICRFYLMDAPYSKWVKATKKMFSGCLPYLVKVTNLNVNSFLKVGRYFLKILRMYLTLGTCRILQYRDRTWFFMH